MGKYIGIDDYLTESAAKYGSKTAIRDDTGKLTYSRFNEQVKALAGFLDKIGMRKGDRIAIYLDNSTDFILSIFAIFKVSGIFIPLPYDDPKERIKKILDNCQPKLILTKREKQVLELVDPTHTRFIIYTDEDSDPAASETGAERENQAGVTCYRLRDCTAASRDFPQEKSDPKSIAYIIYTSGTTGEPKGVAIRHESIVNYNDETTRIFCFDHTTRVLCASPFHFDGSFGSIFCTLKVGGTIIILNRKRFLPRIFLERLIGDDITHWSGTPSLFKVLTEELMKMEPAVPLKLKTVGLGGERCPGSFIKQFQEALPHTRIFNRYGPTETTVVVCSYEISGDRIHKESNVPIGKPQKNVTFYAFNTADQLIEPGETGELYIGGIQVMEKYWQDPQLSAKVLIENKVPGEVLFKTGDLVTIDREGNYIFLDRVDNMINKYGNRIYLSEIENIIASLEDVKDNACLGIQQSDADPPQIVAFIVLKEPITEPELRKILKTRLPAAMIPNIIKFVGAIHYLSNGKLDRKKMEQLHLEQKETGKKPFPVGSRDKIAPPQRSPRGSKKTAVITQSISHFAEKTGDKIALQHGHCSLSYRQLEDRVNAFAYFLEKQGVRRGDRIGIYLENSMDFAMAIFASFKKSCIYVPLPYHDPRERIREMLNNCQPKVIVTDKPEELYPLLDPHDTECVVTTGQPGKSAGPGSHPGSAIRFYSLAECLAERKVIANPTQDPKSLAYIIYTSGSTGRPKGVTVRHESLMNYVREAVIEFGFDRDTRAMSESPYHFDGSFSALYGPMYVGGTNVIFNNRLMLPREFVNELVNHKVTHLSCVPSFFNVMADNIAGETIPYIRLKTVALGGEDCQAGYIRKFKRVFPQTKIFNQYGPTETTDVICGFEIGLEFIEQNSKVPIGKPYKNVAMYAFNENNHLIEPGEIGELYIGGVQVMEGYWQDPQLTLEKLITGKIEGQLLFKTNDLVTLNPDGDYIFIDRKDNMINKYGNRIYLSEIENGLSGLEPVKDVVCMYIQEQAISDIAAFVVLKENLSEEALRNLLKKKLPDFMIPNAIKFLEAIPYMTNGKVDREQLKQLYLRSRKAPAVNTHTARYFQALTGLIDGLVPGREVELDETVNIVDALGFDSMMLLRLIMDIETLYRIQFTREEIDLENFVTIGGIVALLKQKGILMENEKKN